MTPLALFSWQAPRLLERYATTSAWQLRCFDAPDGAEPLPAWDCVTAPGVVVVHSPDAHALARRTWPRARLAWMFHAGHEELFAIPPAHVPEILVCSRRVGAICQAHYPHAKIHVIAPWYAPERVWRWCPQYVFSMLNDPLTRRPERATMTERVVRAASTGATVWERFGRGQPLGPLGGERRRELERSCSGYVDVLPPFAGFGLAHHEMFAAGVPVVSTRWGDTASEVPPDYYTLCDDLGELSRRLGSVLEDGARAAECSELGLEYISSWRTQARMDEQIAGFLGWRP